MSTGYASDVDCPKCGAVVGRSCTFAHFATGQKIATFYHRERIAALRETVRQALKL